MSKTNNDVTPVLYPTTLSTMKLADRGGQHKSILATCTIVILLLIQTAILAQSSSFFNQRDDKYRLLGLKRAKEAYETSRSEYERYKDMYDRQLVAAAELERVRSTYRDAEVNYQQSLLAVLFEQQYVTVASAVKY
ncbi:MAG: hypothetical protein E4G91_03300, partial [Candidatus Zixiibacteriota bacterium]